MNANKVIEEDELRKIYEKELVDALRKSTNSRLQNLDYNVIAAHMNGFDAKVALRAMRKACEQTQGLKLYKPAIVSAPTKSPALFKEVHLVQITEESWADRETGKSYIILPVE